MQARSITSKLLAIPEGQVEENPTTVFAAGEPWFAWLLCFFFWSRAQRLVKGKKLENGKSICMLSDY